MYPQRTEGNHIPQRNLRAGVPEDWGGYRPAEAAPYSWTTANQSSDCFWGDLHPVHGKHLDEELYKDLPRHARVYSESSKKHKGKYTAGVYQEDELWTPREGREQCWRQDMAAKGRAIQRLKTARMYEGGMPAGISTLECNEQRFAIQRQQKAKGAFQDAQHYGPYPVPPQNGNGSGTQRGGAAAMTPRDKDGWAQSTPRGGRSNSITSISLLSSSSAAETARGDRHPRAVTPPRRGDPAGAATRAATARARTVTPVRDWTVESSIYYKRDVTGGD
eukprot:TRINITY_DN7039_c0_g1_i2.p1 TRINITY_DN7039_c0_g1~~TRINITY_DN7039_c0_g1_i2.p1  ORF type:complete len:276 (-),score=51.66 TRINITY_DN7039_c0_g1_i2:44-871(-)